MAGRVPELSFAARGMGVDVEPDQTLTPQIVDAAVESVLAPYDEEVRERYRAAWAVDETSEVARMLQSAVISRSSRLKSYSDVSRRPITVNYSLNTEDQVLVSKRYPEMELRFMPNKQHDHPLAAVDRLLSSVKLHSKMPVGMRYPDFGGSVLMHVEQGNVDVVVVGGVHDVKDAARSTMVRMRLRKLAHDTGVSDVTRMMAKSVLDNEGIYFVESSLQTLEGNYTAGAMSHVYDVPLLDIPKMMNRTGMLLFEGVMHFSSRFFFEEEGEMPGVGARFRISGGEFQMGFVDSPSHWYGHKWDDFSCYGADQILRVAGACYSYKVYENRGDTISFRILRVDSDIRNPGPQYVQRPGVPMVAVNSYEHANVSAMVRGRLSAATRLYPKDVWERMVRSAMLDASRGELDFAKHFKSYRSVVAGHKYNGVSTVSEVVKTTQVPWLVVDSALYGLTQVTMLRRTTRAFAASELERRVLAGSSVLSLTLRSFVTTAMKAMGAVVCPIWSLLSSLMAYNERAVDKLVEVSVQTQLVRIDGRTLVHAAGPRYLVEYQEFPFREQAMKDEALKTFVAAVLEANSSDERGAVRSDQPSVAVEGLLVDVGGMSVSEVVSGTLVESGADIPSWVPFVGDTDPLIKEEYVQSTEFHTPAQRRDAVVETVRAVDAEYKEIEAWASERFSRYAGGRSPDVDEIGRVREANKNFDFWPVNRGMLQQTSLLGADISTFDYAGVYCPEYVVVIDPGGRSVSTRLVPVEDTVYENAVRAVFRSYKSLPVEYTGLVMVSDGMKILNAPHVSAGLKLASNQSFDAELAIMEGGPGCGKSYTISRNFKAGDMVVTPLRKSAKDLREKLVGLGLLTAKAAFRAVRTMDSVLVEAGKKGGFSDSRLNSAFMVHVDECFNANAGRVYAVLALLKAQRVMMYGDRLQIEHVVRADVTLLYSQVEARHVVKRWTVFRSAPEVLAVFNRHYDYKLRTANKVRGEVVMLHGEYPVVQAGEDVMLLVMNQASKAVVKKRYSGKSVEIATTHESQGSEADTVILFNFEVRKIGEDNPVYLYNQDRYVNVAVSRAKRKFIYVYLSGHMDTVKKWIGDAVSPALIQECGNLANAGVSALL